jgi:predicted dehydrogenase
MREVREGQNGRVIHYKHTFGMTFAADFPIRDIWPERFDPPFKSGGGEMTNMGCYAIDYALHTLGVPKGVTARWEKFWAPYAAADVENFGQILLDYGSFWAVLAVGKQAVSGQPGPRNALTIEFESENLFLDPGAGTLIENGQARPLEEYVSDHRCLSALDQLIQFMEEGVRPDSDLETAATGVEVLCAAYESILEGHAISFPMRAPRNPLFE